MQYILYMQHETWNARTTRLEDQISFEKFDDRRKDISKIVG